MEQPLRVLSISQVNAYLACPLKYRFQYVERIEKPWRASALAFGGSIHAAVEWFHRERMAGRIPTLAGVQTIFEADWYAQNVDPLVFPERESRDGLLARGRAMLQLYVSEVESEAPPQAVEQPFEVDLHDPETGEVLDVRFRGFVDLVEEDGTVVDLKTAGRALERGGLERHLQLSAYALAGLQITGEIPPLRLDILYKTAKPRFEQHPTKRTRAELAWTAQLIREVWEAIQTEHFFPNPSWRCTECEYFAHCQAWRGEEADPHQRLVSIEGGRGAGEAAA